MYYIYTETTTDVWYCLANGSLRTTWELALPLALSKPFTQSVHSSSFLDSTIIYSGPIIPTPDTHPELFI